MGAIATLLTMIGMVISGMAVASCDAMPTGAETFVRSHRVHHFNGDPPSVVEDELAMWRTEGNDNCFLLTAIGPNYHQCEVNGIASSIAGDKLEFRDGSCTITFQSSAGAVTVAVSPGWERLGRGGTCTKTRCGMFGEIESGTFRSKR